VGAPQSLQNEAARGKSERQNDIRVKGEASSSPFSFLVCFDFVHAVC
jgi:hypothetical protein